MHTKIGSGAHASTPIRGPRCHEKEWTSRDTELWQGHKHLMWTTLMEPLKEHRAMSTLLQLASMPAAFQQPWLSLLNTSYSLLQRKTATLWHTDSWQQQKVDTHTHVIISDNTFPVKRRLRVNKTPNNSNTCELPIYFCTTCKQSAKIGLCLEVPLWKAHVKAKRSLPRLTASNSAFKNAHSTLHSVLQLSQGQLFLNRADQQYSMCCWIAKCPLQILSGKQLYVGGSWGIQLFRV